MKKVTNFTAMRKAIVTAHKLNNTKAIDKNLAAACDAMPDQFAQWKEDVGKLRELVCTYVKVKHSPTAEPDAVKKAHDALFPVWKDILATGESDAHVRELHVSEYDIDSLVGYAEMFIATSKGTAQAVTGKDVFRKNVESLIGCRIAQNEVLDDNDRDTLQKYYSLQKSIGNADDKLKDLKKSKSEVELLLKDPKIANEKSYLVFLNARKSTIEDEIRKTTTSKADAQSKLAEVTPKAKVVEGRLNDIK